MRTALIVHFDLFDFSSFAKSKENIPGLRKELLFHYGISLNFEDTHVQCSQGVLSTCLTVCTWDIYFHTVVVWFHTQLLWRQDESR